MVACKVKPEGALLRSPEKLYKLDIRNFNVDIRNFNVECMLERRPSASAGIRSERVEAGGEGARGRPYDLDTCGRLPNGVERANLALQCTRRSLVSAPLPKPQCVQVEMAANARWGGCQMKDAGLPWPLRLWH